MFVSNMLIKHRKGSRLNASNPINLLLDPNPDGPDSETLIKLLI